MLHPQPPLRVLQPEERIEKRIDTLSVDMAQLRRLIVIVSVGFVMLGLINVSIWLLTFMQYRYLVEHEATPQVVVAPMGGFCASGGCTAQRDDCYIKGNMVGGKKLYFLPTDPTYAVQSMDALEGDRWFCTREEAEFNQWEHAP